MSDFLAIAYPWVKSLHVMAVVSWLAGLFYLPRLFVYHAQSQDSISQERFVTMERKLFRGIMNPAMVSAWIFGVTLVLTPGVVDWSAGWWHGSLTISTNGMAGSSL